MTPIEPAPRETFRTVHDRAGDPCVLVVFGGSGDLTRRKLIPALFNLAKSGLLPKDFAIIAFAKDDMTAEQLRERVKGSLAEFLPGEFPAEKWAAIERRIFYLQADFQDAKAYTQLGELLAQCDRDHQTKGNYLYYLATPPSMFAPIIHQLGRAKLAREGDESHPGWRRIIIEKPFGRDLATARALNKAAQKTFAEHQIYRIDHYLGKETVQNVMVFRFANGMFEPIWNRRYIDHVEITVAESIGVEGRGRYYEEAGVIRDMIQNHMFQLLALIAMEPPHSFAAEAVRDEKVKVLHAIRPYTPEEILSHAVRGQYGPGALAGQNLPGYRAEPNVSPESFTETYAALKLYVDNWRWADVPFYLRSGKRLPRRVTEIAIQFRKAPLLLFRNTPNAKLRSNRLILHLQPTEGIALEFDAKVPGPQVMSRTVRMDFKYEDYFGTTASTGYETLLYDAMIGDSTLFHRADMVEAAWSVVTPVLELWKTLEPRAFPNYPACTSWGPAEADELLRKDGREWRRV